MQRERDGGVRGEVHRRAGGDFGAVDEQRHAAALSWVQAHERLLDAQWCDRSGWLRRGRLVDVAVGGRLDGARGLVSLMDILGQRLSASGVEI